MKKKLFVVVLSVVVLATGCSNKNTSNQDISTEKETEETTEETTKEATEEATEETTEVETSTEAASEVRNLTITEFDELLAEQPISVIKTEYVVQDEKHKSLYPDILSTVFKNNTDADIKDATLAIVAWDSNNLPVKIEGHMSFTAGEYFNKVNYGDINLAAGETFGENSGLFLSENCKVSSFKSILLSFTTFDGDTWENPYVDSFRKAYEGNKYSDDIMIEVETKDTEFVKSDTPSDNKVDNTSADELSAAIQEQPLYVSNTEYVVQNENYKSLYPDMLQAILQNNSEADIKDAVVAFVAWDENGLPVKIEGAFDFNEPTYVTKVSFADINMIPGSSFGDSKGYELKENSKIKSFKAIVVSYTTFEGEKWDNPLFQDFCDLYEGKRLSE